jgi:hypothetical protein
MAAPQIPLVPLASLGVYHLVNVNAATTNAAWIVPPAPSLKELDGG